MGARASSSRGQWGPLAHRGLEARAPGKPLIRIDIMAALAGSMNGKRLKYDQLIADNGLDSGVRAT